MKRGIRVLLGAVLGLALTIGLLVGMGTPASAETTSATGWIAGKVTDSSGVAAAGKVVTLYTIDDSQVRTQIARTRTSPRGHFWLGSRPVGTYYLLVTDPSQADAPTWWPTPAGSYRPDPFTLTTASIYAEIGMKPGLDISGTTTFQGEPQQGVRVCIIQDIPCAVSDANGAYTLRGIAEGYYKLVADPVGTQPYVRTYYPSHTEASSHLAGPYSIDASSATNSWDFTLQSQPYIGGTVVDEAGAGIAGASVCLGDGCVTSGTDGRWRMNVDLGFHNFQTLNITAPGYADNFYMIGAGMTEAVITMTATTPLPPTPPVTPTEVTATKPIIAGKAKVGGRLTAVSGVWGPEGVVLSYQWYRNGQKISGATKASYRPTWRDWRKKIRVKITGTLEGSTPVTKASKATAKVTWR